MSKLFHAKNIGLFAGGVLFGTAGIKILSSRDAKKVYANCTAAVLRAKNCVMDTVTNIQENAEDIYAEAQEINEQREAEEDDFEDADEDDEDDDSEEGEEGEDAGPDEQDFKEE